MSPISSTRLHVVAACSGTKRVPVADSLRLRTIPTGAHQVSEWIQTLEETSVERSPARDVYGGAHWQTVANLTEEAQAFGSKTQLWALSAGLGLIDTSDPIPAYSATFSAGPDCVGQDLNQRQQWWADLSKWRGLSQVGRPRSLTELAEQFPHDSILIIGSPSYMAAAAKDLRDAFAAHKQSDRIVVASSTSIRDCPDIPFLKADARLQAVMGGARTSLNARVGRWAVRESRGRPLGGADLIRELGRLVAQQPELTRFNRKKLTDREVTDFIRHHSSRQGSSSATQALRALRNSGLACEQKRFGRLFRETTR